MNVNHVLFIYSLNSCIYLNSALTAEDELLFTLFLALIQNLIGFKYFYLPTNQVLINGPISFIKQ